MVNVAKGVLVECDPAMKQFLLHMDEKLALGTKFVVQGRYILMLDTRIFFARFCAKLTLNATFFLISSLLVPVKLNF